MSNVDQRLAAYRDRLLRLETERRERGEDIKELRKEMAGAGVSKDEIAGVMLAVRREFETAERKAKRLSAEEVAESLGTLADTPLGAAAVRAAA